MAKQKDSTAITIRISDVIYEKVCKISVKKNWSRNKVINEHLKTLK